MATTAEQMLFDAEVPVYFADEREEQLVRQAAQGQDAEAFMLSNVGRFVCGAAVQDQREIEAALVNIRPWTPWGRRKIRKLQLKHQAIELGISYLCDQVQIGKGAEMVLREQDD